MKITMSAFVMSCDAISSFAENFLAWAMGCGLINTAQGTPPVAVISGTMHRQCMAKPFVPGLHSRGLRFSFGVGIGVASAWAMRSQAQRRGDGCLRVF